MNGSKVPGTPIGERGSSEPASAYTRPGTMDQRYDGGTDMAGGRDDSSVPLMENNVPN